MCQTDFFLAFFQVFEAVLRHLLAERIIAHRGLRAVPVPVPAQHVFPAVDLEHAILALHHADVFIGCVCVLVISQVGNNLGQPE